MRHAKKGRKLGSDASHKDALLRGLAAQLLKNERIKTTEAKAKELRPFAEKIITLGKRGDLHARRQALALLGGDRELTSKLFEEIPQRYEDRDGGYTRIIKIGPRLGDAAPMVLIELV